MTTKARRLVLHIGPHKTASSYIQENLRAARGALAHRGWAYPKEGTGPKEGKGVQAAHHHLAHNATEYLPAQAPHRADLQTLGNRARAKKQNIVLSAEGFCRWKPANFEALAGILGFKIVELVYVVRDPLDVFHSFWSEEVKQGRTLGFGDRFAREFANPLGSRILNPMQDIAPLMARGRVRLRVVPFDILKRRKIDIFEHFAASILGLPDIAAHHVRPVNRKYPIELTEFLRLLTLMYSGDKPYIGSDFRLRFTALTTAREHRELVTLVQTSAAHARRVITVPGQVAFKSKVEKGLKLRLKDRWSLDVGEDDAIFSTEDAKFVYYSEYLLWKADPVRAAAEEMLKRLAD